MIKDHVTWDRCPCLFWFLAMNGVGVGCTCSHSASHTERRWSRESLRKAPRRSVWWWWPEPRGYSSPSLCCRSHGCNGRGISRLRSPFRGWSSRSRRSADSRILWCSPGAPPPHRRESALYKKYLFYLEENSNERWFSREMMMEQYR